MTAEEVRQGGKQGHAFLTERGEMTADTGEGVGTQLAAERTGDLLLHLDHAHVALVLAIVEGDGDVLYEGEDIIGALQPVEQVRGLALLAPAARQRRLLCRRWIVDHAVGYEAGVALAERSPHLW